MAPPKLTRPEGPHGPLEETRHSEACSCEGFEGQYLGMVVKEAVAFTRPPVPPHRSAFPKTIKRLLRIRRAVLPRHACPLRAFRALSSFAKITRSVRALPRGGSLAQCLCLLCTLLSTQRGSGQMPSRVEIEHSRHRCMARGDDRTMVGRRRA
jgi:hypothetical protein